MFDKELYAQDIKGSIAHSKMLAIQGIITIEDQEKIEKGLLRIKEEIEAGEFEWKIEHEDVHMAIESKLTEYIGEAGGDSILQEAGMTRWQPTFPFMFRIKL